MAELGAHLPYLMATPRSITHVSAPQPEDKVTATLKPFQYTRLQDNQIRVLRLSIDPDTKYLICSFDVRDLTTCPGTYRAISYCWGDPKPTHSLLCSTGDHLNLTESAAEVLKFVLTRNPGDWFWIDQVCINQADLVERSAQVSMMGQIYSSTKQVGLSVKVLPCLFVVQTRKLLPLISLFSAHALCLQFKLKGEKLTVQSPRSLHD